MLHHLPVAMESALLVLAGGFITLVVSQFVAVASKRWDLKSAERARLFDLYKVVYPEKVKAVSAIKDRLESIYLQTDPTFKHSYAVAKSGGDRAVLISRFDDELAGLEAYARASEVLLGPRVVGAVLDFRQKCINPYVETGATIGQWVTTREETYQRLTSVLYDSVHLHILEGLLPRSAEATSEDTK